MPGLGAEVLRRMGATVVTIPGGEIVERAQIRRDRRQPSGSDPGRILDLGLDKVGRLLLLPGLPRARHERDPRHQQDAVGRADALPSAR